MLWSLEQAQDYLQRRVTERLSNNDPEAFQQPPASLLTTALSGIAVCGEEELRNLYAELVTSSINGQRAHPAFANLIRDLSADEARILGMLKARGVFHAIELKDVRDAPHSRPVNFWTLLEQIELLEAKADVLEYVENLTRLGLLGSIRQSDSNRDFAPALDSMELSAIANLSIGSELVTRMTSYVDSDGVTRGGILDSIQYHLTVFGRAFVNACVEVANDTAASLLDDLAEKHASEHTKPGKTPWDRL